MNLALLQKENQSNAEFQSAGLFPVANLRVKLADTDSVKVQGSNKPSSSVSGGMTLFHLQRKMLLPQRLEAAWAPINSLRLSR